MPKNRSFWLRTGRWLALGVIVVAGIVLGPLQHRLAQWLYEEQRPTALPAAVDTPDLQTSNSPVNKSDGDLATSDVPRATDSIPA